MKTLVIGAAIVDVIMKIPNLPKSGEDVLCNETKITVGGCAYNVANILRGLNIQHELFVPVGSGIYADIVKKALSEDGYKILVDDSEMDNGYCLCLVEDSGERTFITVNGIEGVTKREWFESLNIDEYSNIYVAGYQLCANGASVLADWLCEQKDKNIFFAPGPVINNIDKAIMEKLFSTNPIFHLNEKEALDFSKKDNVEESILYLYELTKNNVFITLGEKGTLFFDGQEVVHIEGEKVDVVDTIGAGDSHIGAIISVYSLGYDFIEGCKLANKVAAEVVQVQGAKLSEKCFSKFNL